MTRPTTAGQIDEGRHSPTALGGARDAPKPSRQARAAAAPPSIARSATPMISRSPPRQSPEDYAEMLEESGVKVQARAPMTAVAKLVFGIGYDKARLTEFAAALCNAHRQEVAAGRLQDLHRKAGRRSEGLVAAERNARRPEPKADNRAKRPARAQRRAPARSRRSMCRARKSSSSSSPAAGTTARHEVVAIVDDKALLERAIRRAA